MSTAPAPVLWSLLTPAGVSGAIAMIGLSSRDSAALSAVLARICDRTPSTGASCLARVAGVDEAVVIRWSEHDAVLMPHGGVEIVRAICARLAECGAMRAAQRAGADAPEAASEVESRMLAALSQAASPLAIDLLLRQPELWSSREHGENEPARDMLLRRLIVPPLVVAVGPANIGKSTLLNTLAGRGVSITADLPGTTRDHVGAELDLAGLVVRWLDTPGLRESPDPLETEAWRLLAPAIAAADLLLLCGDGEHPPILPDAAADSSPGRTLRIALRADVGRAEWPHDARVSARTGEGVAELVRLVRDRLVPPEFLEARIPWRFWEEEDAGRGSETIPPGTAEQP